MDTTIDGQGPPNKVQLELWWTELNQMLPGQIDSTTPAGSDVVQQFRYIPGSVRISDVEPEGEGHRMMVTYQVQHTELPSEDELVLRKPHNLVGAMVLFTDADCQFELDGICFLEGLVDAG